MPWQPSVVYQGVGSALAPLLAAVFVLDLGSALCFAPSPWVAAARPPCWCAGKTKLRELRKLIEETRRGKTSFRSRMFNDVMYFFNDAPNPHDLPDGMRRKYRFGIAPKRPASYEDSKVQEEHPMVVPLERETEMVADQVLPRYLEKQTVLVIQGERTRVSATASQSTSGAVDCSTVMEREELLWPVALPCRRAFAVASSVLFVRAWLFVPVCPVLPACGLVGVRRLAVFDDCSCVALLL